MLGDICENINKNPDYVITPEEKEYIESQESLSFITSAENVNDAVLQKIASSIDFMKCIKLSLGGASTVTEEGLYPLIDKAGNLTALDITETKVKDIEELPSLQSLEASGGALKSSTLSSWIDKHREIKVITLQNFSDLNKEMLGMILSKGENLETVPS